MSVSYLRPRQHAPRAGAAKFCPVCRSALFNGPVVFYCATCRRQVRSADVPTETSAPAPQHRRAAA
ncbi:hypothetical protein ACFVH6_30440 [Spirillospora sp. NPDC127200]